MRMVSTRMLTQITGFSAEFFHIRREKMFLQGEHYIIDGCSCQRNTYIWFLEKVQESLIQNQRKANGVNDLLARID